MVFNSYKHRFTAVFISYNASFAQKYLPAPAASKPEGRVFSADELLVDKLRAALTADNVDALVYLHKNAEVWDLSHTKEKVEVAGRRQQKFDAGGRIFF